MGYVTTEKKGSENIGFAISEQLLLKTTVLLFHDAYFPFRIEGLLA